MDGSVAAEVALGVAFEEDALTVETAEWLSSGHAVGGVLSLHPHHRMNASQDSQLTLVGQMMAWITES